MLPFVALIYMLWAQEETATIRNLPQVQRDENGRIKGQFLNNKVINL